MDFLAVKISPQMYALRVDMRSFTYLHVLLKGKPVGGRPEFMQPVKQA